MQKNTDQMFFALRKDMNGQTTDLNDGDDVSKKQESPTTCDTKILSDIGVDVDDEVLPAQKPHFLDYDAVPPSDFEENFDRVLTFGTVGPKKCEGELLKVDKKFERDGEISDFELAASGYTKKEFTQDDNTLHLPCGGVDSAGVGAAAGNSLRKSVFAKPKHFLDENPIPPDYMLKQELREHHSLDRNFERQSHSHSTQLGNGSRERTESPQASSADLRNVSMDRSSSAGGSSSRSSRERFKEPSYTLSRFLDSDPKQISCVGGAAGLSSPASLPPLMHSLTSANAWTDSFDSRYGSLQLPATMGSGTIFPEVVDTLGPKVECVYSLLSMLGSNDPLETSKKFLELSRTPETCATLRRSGCIPLLVQMMHSSDGEENVRKWAGMALHNVVHSHPDEKAGRREAKVLRLLDQIIDYCNFLKTLLQSGGEAIADDSDRHPLAAISSLMKVSFDEEHRHAMCELGALQAIPNLVHLDHAVHGPKPEDQCCNSLRRYALMALTNLTFGDENNKAFLCSQKVFMEALVAQLDSAPDDLLQVTASVLRNLSWRADVNMKAVLNEIGTVTALARAAMKNKCENTLKAILSALWNLSAHCSTNKAEFCAVDGALAFLVKMLTYEGPSKTLKIIENAGGILRNVSSHIAVREHYRQILREHNCLAILLQQLKSESLTVVSNSCGTLWNLSARCPEDQKFLWDNGAVPMLRSLIHSKHAMISEGSSSALKNLLNFRPSVQNQSQLDPIARSMGLKKLPTLNARKQKALEQELEEKEHSETCDNLDVIATRRSKERNSHRNHSTNYDAQHSQMQRRCYPLAGGIVAGVAAAGNTVTTTPSVVRLTRSAMLTKSESRDSIFSAKSDSVYENLMMRSHSASDTNRGNSNAANPMTTQGTVSVGQHLPRRSAAAAFVAIDNENEAIEEQPIDYSIKYKEDPSKRRESQKKSSIDRIDLEREDPNAAASGGFTVYQETDLDQPTDFSLRYAENQIESDADISPPDADIDAVPPSPCESTAVSARSQPNVAVVNDKNATKGNQILLILEDSVKCYQTEDTPYVISNAASVTDLRQNNAKATKNEDILMAKGTKCADNPETHNNVSTKGKYHPMRATNPPHGSNGPPGISYISGSYTPEKPINYCEEGTPGYFSRYESLSSLDESPPSATAAKLDSSEHTEQLTEAQSAVATEASHEKHTTVAKESASDVEQRAETPPPKHENDMNVPQINSAQETPLMFSRHSSMDSLVEEDVGPCDDKSSVISDFSRLASGVISPSELPDSPTQSMPQSPRRNSSSGMMFSSGMSPVTPRGVARQADGKRHALRSVFEDDVNAFNVEHTPAQFSCATSLSNLSIIDDEQNSPPDPANNGNDVPQQEQVNDKTSPSRRLNVHTLSEGEEEEEVEAANNDDLLLASCINMGMKRATTVKSPGSGHASGGRLSEEDFSKEQKTLQSNDDEPRHYYTEDTPALLSKVGSNSNLSAISICSSNADLKGGTAGDQQSQAAQRSERLSLNLSDVESSNASESGGCSAGGPSILEQCIRDGMKKPHHKLSTPQQPHQPISHNYPTSAMDPIAMMRRGGNSLPPCLCVTDEMSRFVVEDSPCNFSVVSGLSNLTVGSSLVGPAVQLQESRSGGDGGTGECTSKGKAPTAQVAPPVPPQRQEDVRRDRPQSDWQDDSLSSLSIDSEDDTNLLSQAIAAGCNRPKSNLGFSTPNNISSKRSSSLSASQPIPINAATSASSLNAASSSRRHHQHGTDRLDKRQQQPHHHNHGCNGNESSFSSVDSSDSNDNQSKSLFELCIMTGMQKSTNRDSRKQHHQNAQQNIQPHHHNHLALLNANVTQSNPNLKQPYAESSTKHSVPANRHVRDRERKDERLLMECINTGITKKISGSGGNGRGGVNSLGNACNDMMENINANANVREQLAFTAKAVSKNVQATSAAVSEQCPPTEDTTFPSAPSTAAPDVESTNTSKNAINNTTHNHLGDTTSIVALRNHPLPQPHPQMLQHQCDDDHRNREIETAEMTNDIGCNNVQNTERTLSNSLSLDNTTSDESNQSFIMETTISLDPPIQQQKHQTPLQNQTDAKHKDPDLMLKSVERLTLEFVSSAEQLRTNGSSDSHETHPNSGKRMGSISLGVTSNSNNTWNEDTCPNDVSFPSLSVTAPVVASLKSDYSKDDHDDDYDDEQATEADHKEIHDFAEITPTNEEQPPPPSLIIMYDNDDLAGNNGGTQPNSLGTETETYTLVNKSNATEPLTYTANTNSNTGSSGINFKLGGEVQSAAVAVAANRNLFFNSTNAMTNSTIIAIEARALADNLQCQRSTSTDTDEVTFSLTSLDLDNVRPPSGMDSLNMSGYYQQDLTPGCSTQPNSMQRLGCGILMGSPKFPRKSLPAGLVAKRALGQLPGHLSGSTDSVNSSCNLLDNIKPPSLMDELLDSMMSVASIQSEVADCESMATTMTGSAISHYETAAGCNEFDDNTVTLQSCCDYVLPRDDGIDDNDDDDDDVTAKSGTPLPSDGDYSSAETTPKKSNNSGSGVRRTLTPKQKRKMAKDRFKTYTIAADIVLGDTTANVDENETLQIEIIECEGKPDRYQTQTIEYPSKVMPSADVFTSFVISCDEHANNSLTSTDDCLSDDASSIRAMTKQFKYITAPAPVAIEPPRTEFSNGYADKLESSEYCDQNSETESCHEHQHHPLVGQESEGSGDVEHEEAKTRTAKPRIVKPDDPSFLKDSNDDENDEAETNGQSPKAIRGRKKPAYVSPYSMQYQRNTALVTRLTTNKLITTTAPTAAVFRKRNTNNTATQGQTTTKLAQKKKTNEVVSTVTASSAATVQAPALERQGTFVKDEPTNASVEVPIVEVQAPTAKSPQSSPSHKRSSKLPMKQQPQTNKTTLAYTRKATVVGAAVRRVVSQQMVATTQRSNSNASIRVTSSTSRVVRVSTTTPPSRSNSNLNSAAAANSAASAASKIHQAQSRIASMWKRVDEAKKAMPANTKCTPESTTSRISHMRRPPTMAPKTNGDSGPRKSPHKPTLIRSSTFDNTPALEGAVTPVINGGSCNGNETKSKIAITRNIAGANRHISARK